VVLEPRAFVLATTRERVHLRHEARIAARVEGRSSLARVGLIVHLTAPTIHAGDDYDEFTKSLREQRASEPEIWH
jgi:deoxycytidine triphosphate deaminase